MRFVVPSSGTVLDNPCAMCGTVYGATCCEWKDGSREQFPMSCGEALKISQWTKIPISQAAVIRPVTGRGRRILEDFGGGVLQGLIVDGLGIFLPIEDERCIYLGRSGCTIPNAKPALCSLYPFSVEDGEITTRHCVPYSGFCFGADIANGNVQDTLGIFGETDSTIRAKYSAWQRQRKLHAAQFRRLLHEARQLDR